MYCIQEVEGGVQGCTLRGRESLNDIKRLYIGPWMRVGFPVLKRYERSSVLPQRDSVGAKTSRNTVNRCI